MPDAADRSGPWALPTPFDHALRLEARDGALVAASLEPGEPDGLPAPPPRLREPLEAYLADPAGGLPDLDVDLSGGTAFQRRVWDALRSIPAGDVRTYGAVAAEAGSPAAARAVGQAVGANPVPLVVPCHRVVPASGGIGGYGAGTGPPLKRRLLSAEGAPLPDGG